MGKFSEDGILFLKNPTKWKKFPKRGILTSLKTPPWYNTNMMRNKRMAFCRI